MSTLSYEIDGSILTLRASGPPTLSVRQPVFDAVRADATVPNQALVLLDVREVDQVMSEYVVIERLRVLVEQLGQKLGPLCAIIVRQEHVHQARMFQQAGRGLGLRVELFGDEASARQWLKSLP